MAGMVRQWSTNIWLCSPWELILLAGEKVSVNWIKGASEWTNTMHEHVGKVTLLFPLGETMVLLPRSSVSHLSPVIIFN